MMAVVFEVVPKEGHTTAYLNAAAALRPHLEEIGGFIFIERFQSFTDSGKLLSLSYWRDEEAVAAWRKLEVHRQTQRLGCEQIFENYRLRVAHVVRDYGMHDRAQAPDDSREIHG